RAASSRRLRKAFLVTLRHTRGHAEQRRGVKRISRDTRLRRAQSTLRRAQGRPRVRIEGSSRSAIDAGRDGRNRRERRSTVVEQWCMLLHTEAVNRVVKYF